MTFGFEPGNALGCMVNSHRHGWVGKICEHAAAWNCGAKHEFREDYCERGDPRCFHLHLFDEADPHMIIPEDGAGWILEQDEHALDDQMLILWGRQASGAAGVPEWHNVPKLVFGAYRILRAQPIRLSHRTDWKIVPHADGWTRMMTLRVEAPRFRQLSGPYIKEVDRPSAERLFNEALDAARTAPWFDPGDQKRFEHFASQVQSWLKAAAARVPRPARASPREAGATTSLRPLFSHIKIADPPPRAAAVKPAPAPPKASGGDDAFAAQPLIEEGKRDWITANYGGDTLTRLLVASLTKPLLILRGRPGVGKSTVAQNLTQDRARERTLIVPVASTWRGREDLLGFINPISNLFEPTVFTRFLLRAARAWDAGDRRTHLVIFEEFNLSQPEFWLADVLARSQYPVEPRADRVIPLGGQGIRGEAGAAEVFLSPAARFVATINTDHTTRPLSARILDRAAVVELTMDPRHAIRLVAMELSEEHAEAIADLDFITGRKDATFSLRTARTLKSCFEQLAPLGIDPWKAIDLVLAQEVLSKVKLLVGDPVDQGVCEELKKWADGHGKNLPECARLIATWDEMLQDGQDVAQA
ncbi:MAG: hypothetical protein U1E76_03740 [Planctomycetota bacterium]